MANYKLTISDKNGKSISKEVKETDANPLLGLEIPAETDASIVGLSGKITITGGSDKSGVPMRGDVSGNQRRKILMRDSVGFNPVKDGQRKRKLIRGRTLSGDVSQVNLKVIDYGPKSIEELLKPEEA